MALWYPFCSPEFHRRDCRSKQAAWLTWTLPGSSRVRGYNRRRAPLAPRFGRETALGGAPSTGNSADDAAGLGCKCFRCGLARLRRLQHLANKGTGPVKVTSAVCVVRRDGPAFYWDRHLSAHWTLLHRPIVPIPTDLRRHGSARYHRIGRASTLRTIDIFILPECFDA